LTFVRVTNDKITSLPNVEFAQTYFSVGNGFFGKTVIGVLFQWGTSLHK
jgi:hypothetical protein